MTEFQELQAENDSLHEKSAQMESDLRTVAKVFIDLLKSLNIDPTILKGGQDMRMVLPSILSNITRQLMSGGFDTESIANISAVAPILEKYKHLIDDIIPDEAKIIDFKNGSKG